MQSAVSKTPDHGRRIGSGPDLRRDIYVIRWVTVPAPIVTQTVILAAGNGSRLTPGANGLPKPLVEVCGVPLIGHALEHARASGCDSAVVVIGPHSESIRHAVEPVAARLDGLRIEFIVNPRTTEPNGISLMAAEPFVHPAFYLQMVDHVFAEVALPKLTAEPLARGEFGRLLIDRRPKGIDLSDATKVRLDGSRIVAIGKQIEPWDAVDAGCFVLTAAVFDAFRRVVASEPHTVSSGMRQLAVTAGLGAVDIGDIEWVDVDTPGDLNAAEQLLAHAAMG
jgi:choline kinase